MLAAIGAAVVFTAVAPTYPHVQAERDAFKHHPGPTVMVLECALEGGTLETHYTVPRETTRAAIVQAIRQAIDSVDGLAGVRCTLHVRGEEILF